MVQSYCAWYTSRSFYKAPWSSDACTGHIQTTKVGVGPAGTTTKPRVQHASAKWLSSRGSTVQERTEKCPGKKKNHKIHRWKFQIRKRKSECSEMFDVSGDYGYIWPVLTEFHNKVPEGITCKAFNFSQLDFDAGRWIFKALNASLSLWLHMLSVRCDELLHKK